ARLIEQYGESDWGKLFAFAAACFGTFITTFANTLNNHTVAAYCALFAICPLMSRLGRDEEQTNLDLIISGLFAGLTAAFELPALAFALALFVRCQYRQPSRTIVAFLPAMAVPIAGQIVLNFISLGEVWPAYSKVGGPWYQYE